MLFRLYTVISIFQLLSLSIECAGVDSSAYISEIHSLKQEIKKLSAHVESLYSLALSNKAVEDKEGNQENQNSIDTVTTSQIPRGIFPVLRDMGCTHFNLETPRLVYTNKGNGRVIIDVGIGYEGEETYDAMLNGFNLIAIEMLPSNIKALEQVYKDKDRIHFITLELTTEQDGTITWNLPKHVAPFPELSKEGHGSIYFIHAGLDARNAITTFDSSASISFEYSLGDIFHPTAEHLEFNVHGSHVPKEGMVPVVKLDDILPTWIDSYFMLKIDSQGWELLILKGTENALQKHQFEYIQYEFAPWLMIQANSGDPFELAEYLPSLGALCFDQMSPSHNPLPRPSYPTRKYVERLIAGGFSEVHHHDMPLDDPFGPWDDITCYFPQHGH